MVQILELYCLDNGILMIDPLRSPEAKSTIVVERGSKPDFLEARSPNIMERVG